MNSLLKRLPIEIAAALLGILVAAMALGGTFLFSMGMRHLTPYADAVVTASPQMQSTRKAATLESLVAQGRHLYLANCAHCHAPDATGDEGPDLHEVKKSDARIASMIQNGVKGEMPKFGAKLKEAEVRALIAYIRSLK